MDNINFGKAVNRVNRCVIGHNRYATQGASSKQNAHPFEFETVIGVHNGTLNNKWALKSGNDFSVDSQALYNHIDKEGLRSAINISQGAWSLVWWDKVAESLNFLRNKERPMFVAHALKTDTIFFASEKWMLLVACSREEVDIAEPYETMEDVHYEYSISKTSSKICKPVVREMKAPEPVHRVIGYTGFQQQHQQRNIPWYNADEAEPPKKVHILPKASKVASIGNATASGATYSGSKNVSLEVLDSTFDSHGAAYVTCFDPNMPSTNIRLYLNKKDDPKKIIGKLIIGNIGNYYIDKNRSDKSGYYKVEYSSYKLDPSEVQKPIIEEFLDHTGTYLNKEMWMDKYNACCWCSSPIFPEDKHKFVKTGGNVLCEVCMDDKEVLAYIE